MKRFLAILFLICILFSLSACDRKEKNITNDNSTELDKDTVAANSDIIENGEDDLKTLSEELAQQMVEGDFKDTYDRCSISVKNQLSEKQLKDSWDVTIIGMGKYISLYQTAQSSDDKYQTIDVILRYEYNGLKVSFVYNSSGELDGLWFNYSPIEEEAANTDTYEEIKITFGDGDYPITGILTLSKGVSNPPVAILVPGSGNHDINETVGANKPFRDLAWGLAEQGIASIRYNERVFSYPELAQGEFTIQIDSLDDAADAVTYALICSQIDSKNIFIVGHSLGAMMAPKIANDNPEVSGIALLAGSPRRLEDIVYDQAQYQINHTEGVTKSQADKAISDTEAAIEAIRTLTQGSTQPLLGYPSSYWYSLNQIDIAGISANLDIPIYIAQGSADFQVYADKDYPAWQELLGDKVNVTFKLYDNLNHLFMTTNGKKDITEYNTPGNVDQTVIDDIAIWIKNN